MKRFAMLAVLATLSFAGDASAIEMFTFYGSGEHYAGYPYGGQHYVRAAGFSEHYAGTPYMGYAANVHGHDHGYGCNQCGGGHHHHRKDCFRVWDGFCAEKCQPKCSCRHGHLRHWLRHLVEKHRCRRQHCDNDCNTCGSPEPCGCEAGVNYGVEPYGAEPYGVPHEMAPTEAEPNDVPPTDDSAPIPPGPSVRRFEIWPNASALFPAPQQG